MPAVEPKTCNINDTTWAWVGAADWLHGSAVTIPGPSRELLAQYI